MTDIEKILNTGKSDRSGGELMPTNEEFRQVESELDFRFPESYREFVRLGGLNELRINHRVLSPVEILQSRRYLPDHEHVPFADNGCGDFYCWPRVNLPEPTVLFADHETETYSDDTSSFTQWVKQNRF
ncbi:MAG TPA: SMI1/KNR4 family protein [Verrucomicrobiae bacterium]|nr:SMI1/KNR4 family protein [Verrucomicrobiae bacterium]